MRNPESFILLTPGVTNFTDRSRASVFVYINRINGEDLTDPLLLRKPFSSALNQQGPSLWIRANRDWTILLSTLNHFTASLTREPQIWHELSADQNWPQQLGPYRHQHRLWQRLSATHVHQRVTTLGEYLAGFVQDD